MHTCLSFRKNLILVLIASLFSVSTFAKPNKNDSYLSVLGQEIASPVTTKAWPWLVGGAVTTALLAGVLKNDIVDPLQKDFSENKPLGDLSQIGNLSGLLIPNALYATGMYLNYYFNENDLLRKRSFLMFKASVYSMSITTGLKPLVGETRPNGRDDLSFPSGHATAAFVFSGFVMAEHDFWPWGVSALALSTLTAASRINDNKHYLHDVVGGATIGLVYGLGLSYLYKSNTVKDESISSSLNEIMFVPIYNSEFKGLSLTMGF